MTPLRFRNLVRAYHATHGRHALPWRQTTSPYRILVSEIMLQQTQVERVIPFYQAWMRKYPSVRALAQAPLGDVLSSWQGLGYNRRAKALHETAKAVTKKGGTFPKTVAELEKLPGIGPYTARAVMAFAHNEDVIFIETNIRTAVIHHFFPGHTSVDDTELLPILEKALPRGHAREWYAALMDYGASLKRSGIRLNAKTKGYTKQSTFAGSTRQARGAILRALIGGPIHVRQLVTILGEDRKEQLIGQLKRLYLEGMVEQNGNTYSLPK